MKSSGKLRFASELVCLSGDDPLYRAVLRSDDDARQLSFDLEQAYNAFHKFIKERR